MADHITESSVETALAHYRERVAALNHFMRTDPGRAIDVDPLEATPDQLVAIRKWHESVLELTDSSLEAAEKARAIGVRFHLQSGDVQGRSARAQQWEEQQFGTRIVDLKANRMYIEVAQQFYDRA